MVCSDVVDRRDVIDSPRAVVTSVVMCLSNYSLEIGAATWSRGYRFPL